MLFQLNSPKSVLTEIFFLKTLSANRWREYSVLGFRLTRVWFHWSGHKDRAAKEATFSVFTDLLKHIQSEAEGRSLDNSFKIMNQQMNFTLPNSSEKIHTCMSLLLISSLTIITFYMTRFLIFLARNWGFYNKKHNIFKNCNFWLCCDIKWEWTQRLMPGHISEENSVNLLCLSESSLIVTVNLFTLIDPDVRCHAHTTFTVVLVTPTTFSLTTSIRAEKTQKNTSCQTDRCSSCSCS